ncbi:site-specific DNA-methyltransferase [Candidatus Poribacteria bacterium]|nr:site-specific DNA-methyltransferase [Candidatus Poribacteria bacterium]
MKATVLHGDCASLLDRQNATFGHVDLTFLDPPFNQDKGYNEWDDNLPEAQYWKWMGDVCTKIYDRTASGGAIYFMQREKKTESVLRCLRESGWIFQNLIIWKKKTSAVPGMNRFGKHYQIIAFATKGERPRVFHRLRINPPLPAGYKYERENGMFVTDVWDDIRELTSGYFAGDEALRDAEGNRLHKQQTPIQLLLRIILSSTNPGDVVLDPFAGSGTALVVAEQLERKSIGIELDKINVKIIEERLAGKREADNISGSFKDYECTPDLATIWGRTKLRAPATLKQGKLFESNR